MVSRRRTLVSGLGVAVGLVTAGCSQGSDTPTRSSWSQPPDSSSGSSSEPQPSPTSAAAITVTPAANTEKVSPTKQVVVTVSGGTVRSVNVTTGGKSVKGALAGDGRSWRTSASLKYGKTYQVAVAAVDDAGVAVEQTSTFTTVKPKATAAITFQANALYSLKDGGTYGVGQPVIVRFSEVVKSRSAAEKAMTVTTEPAVEGRWRWIDSQTAHWRPEKYWAAGTKISVSVRVFGVNLGNGVYGGSNAEAGFTIGKSRVAIADAKSHHMKVYIDGKMVRDIPVSLGKGGTATTTDGSPVDFWTRSGPHVVLSKESSHRMTSASYGITDKNDPNYYDEPIKLCCRISYSGEFTHLADWNIWAHGHANTSHGCINIGPADAQWFYNTFQVGDVVEVRNTPKQLPLTDGLGDWTVDFDDW